MAGTLFLGTRRLILFLMASSLFPSHALGDTVWGAIVWNQHGEVIPNLSDQPADLTPLGAEQSYNAGQLIRNRYVSTAANANRSQLTTNSQIAAINEFEVNNNQLYVSSPDSHWIANSAEAFMQGVYPPYANPDANPKYDNANGSSTRAPLGNYQYVRVHTPGYTDPLSIYTDPTSFCPQWGVAARNYYASNDFNTINNATVDLYNRIRDALLSDILPPQFDEFVYAKDIYDYVTYEVTHNATAAKLVSADDLQQLRYLASSQEFDRNGNLTASGYSAGDNIAAIAGQTTAARVLGLLSGNINSQGQFMKLSAIFTDYIPFMAYFSLAGLTRFNVNFYGLPEPGSSMVWELFTTGSTDRNGTYPSIDNLRVRFLFRNGTSGQAPLVQYPLFTSTVDRPDLSWNDFLAGSEGIMTRGVGNWCDKCGAVTAWCALYGSNATLLSTILGQNVGSGGGGTVSGSNNQKLSNAVAGVIGAVVTLAVAGLVIAAVLLFFGVGFHRRPSRRSSRKSMGGFKGSEKLASDADLPGSGAAAAGVAPVGAAAAARSRGHERVQSWELGKKRDDVPPRVDTVQEREAGAVGLSPTGQRFRKEERVSEDIERIDPFADGVQPHDRV